jgi:hypothetical protein
MPDEDLGGKHLAAGERDEAVVVDRAVDLDRAASSAGGSGGGLTGDAPSQAATAPCSSSTAPPAPSPAAPFTVASGDTATARMRLDRSDRHAIADNTKLRVRAITRSRDTTRREWTPKRTLTLIR